MYEKLTRFNRYSIPENMLYFNNVLDYAFEMTFNFSQQIKEESKLKSLDKVNAITDLIKNNNEIKNLNEFMQESISLIALQLTLPVQYDQTGKDFDQSLNQVMQHWGGFLTRHLLEKYQDNPNTYDWYNNPADTPIMQFSEYLSCAIYQINLDILEYNHVKNDAKSNAEYIKLIEDFYYHNGNSDYDPVNK